MDMSKLTGQSIVLQKTNPDGSLEIPEHGLPQIHRLIPEVNVSL
jgi:hypothetical protein